MSTYMPVYGVTEALETQVIRSTVMVRLNPHDIINQAITKVLHLAGHTLVDPEFVEFADNGDIILRATIIKPVESTLK